MRLFLSTLFTWTAIAFFPSGAHAVNTNTIYWQTWDIYGGGTDPAASTMQFYGLDKAGGSALKLAKDVYQATSGATRTSKGDYVELGYFASDAAGTPSATSGDLFKGTNWIPLTSSATIGMRSLDVAAAPPPVGGEVMNLDGEYFAVSNFTDDAGGSAHDKAVTYIGTPYVRTDTITNLNLKLDALDTAATTAAGNDGFLAVRFFDVDTTGGSHDTIGGQQSDLASNGKQARYNTVASAAWKWVTRDSSPVTSSVNLDNGSGTLNTLEFELPNDTGAYSGVEIGTGGSNTIGSLSDGNAKRTATVAYRDDTALNLANTGDTIVSMLDDATYGTVANITGDGATTQDLTIMARSSGTTYSYSGDITNKTDVFKIGAGDQAFTGSITTTGALSIDEGKLSLKPDASAHGNIGAATRTQSFEYITDDGSAGSLAINNDADASHVVELGFAATTTAQTFSGTIALSDDGTNTLKVGGATGVGHQKFSGNISGESSAFSSVLKKTGGGKLTLSGSGSDFDGGVTITHSGGATKEGGIVVAGHANALGSGVVTVEHGKLAVDSGITITNTIIGGSADTTKKSVIGGGVGTSAGIVDNSAGARLDIGASANDINVVSPGIALASSMSNGTSDNQVLAGNEDDGGTAAAANSIGTLEIKKLGLESGGVFDWEVKHFDGTAGTDWDVLQFQTLDFDTGTFDLNIYSIDSNGAVGKPTDTGGNTATLWDDGGNSFKFLDGPNHGAINFTGGGWASDGSDIDDFFVINADAFSHTNGMWGGDWSVRYDGSGDFFLDFAAVPEPSTYVMVTGLLLLPGFRFLRRFRSRKDKGGD